MNDLTVNDALLILRSWPVWLKLLLRIGLQLGVLGLVGWWVYARFIRKSQAELLLKGLSIILLGLISLWGLSHWLRLPILEFVFSACIQLLFIGLLVIFQPELRRLLLFLGQPEFFSRPGTLLATSAQRRNTEHVIDILVESLRFLSRSKTGALIVLEMPHNPGGNYLEAGTPVKAQLSTQLLLTIFHPNTPLHDGAVVINRDLKIAAAGVLLPLTEDPTLSWQYGTRHRAAIGLSESSDSVCLVVSEETGSVSFVQGGVLERLADINELRHRLEALYNLDNLNQPNQVALAPVL